MKHVNFKLILKIIFSIGLILFLGFKLDLEKIGLLKLDALIPYIIALGITLLSLSFMSYRWKVLIDGFLHTQPPFKKLWKFYLIGAFFNIFLPGAIGGDLVRTQRLTKNCNVTLKNASLVTLAERFSGVYGLLLILSCTMVFLNFPPVLNLGKYLPLWVFQMSPLVVLLSLPILKLFLKRNKLRTSYRLLLKIILISLAGQMGDIVIAYMFSQYFDVTIPFSAFFFIMPLVFVVTVLPISLGGLGVREGAFSGLMMLYGIDTSIAIIISLLMYLVKVGVGIMGYVVYLKER